jgi:O-antigen/teichoic acid export membrane protein
MSTSGGSDGGQVIGDPASPEQGQPDGGSIRRRAATGLVTVGIRGTLIRAIGFLGNVVLARKLVPSEFGELAFGLAIMTTTSILTSGGIGAALIGRRQEPTRDELRAVCGFLLAATCVGIVIVAAIGIPLGTPGRLATIMSLCLPLEAARAPKSIMFERRMAFGQIVRAEVTDTLTYTAFAVTAVLVGFGVWGVAVATIMGSLAGLLVLAATRPRGLVRPSLSLAPIRSILRFGMQFQGVGLVNTARDQGLNVGMVAISGTAVLGFWTLALRLMSAAFIIFESGWRVSYPAISRLIEAGENPRRALERALSFVAIITGLVVTPLGGAAPLLVPVLFGPGWHETALVLSWTCLALLLNGSVSVCITGYLYAVGDAGRVLRAIVAHTIVWFVVGLPLVRFVGVQAIGIGAVAASATDLVILGGSIRSRLGLPLRGALVPPFVAGVLAGGGALLFARSFRPTFLSAAVALMVAAVGYVAILLILDRTAVIEFARFVLRLARRAKPAPAGVEAI